MSTQTPGTTRFKILGRDPALWVASIAAALSLLVSLGFEGLNAEQAALIIAAINAILGVVAALMVRPIAPAAFTFAVSAVAALLAGYGFDIDQAHIGAVNALVLAVLALITRQQVAPQQTALTRS